MFELILFNLGLIALIVVGLVLCKKFVKTDSAKYWLLLIASIATIACHYSSIVYHAILDGSQLDFLKSNPNLILPIYPCNVIMWSCLIFGIMKNKQGKTAKFFIDFIFWFGILSCLVGMFANVDFINNPDFSNYDATKSVIAHAFMLFNVLLLPVFGFVKIDLPRNMLNVAISIVVLLVIGLYCNLVFTILVSKQAAYNVNSMFLLHSPFEGAPFLTFPFIACVAIVGYFFIFWICELFCYKKGERWYSRIKKYFQDRKQEKLNQN